MDFSGNKEGKTGKNDFIKVIWVLFNQNKNQYFR